eukprot:scaffold207809_cov32-Tisochrysis_lutea.AAC.4
MRTAHDESVLDVALAPVNRCPRRLPLLAPGVGAMELIALDLKRRGMYICRQLSFKAATFNTQTIDLTQRQMRMYDEASTFWNELLSCLYYAVHEVCAAHRGCTRIR